MLDNDAMTTLNESSLSPTPPRPWVRWLRRFEHVLASMAVIYLLLLFPPITRWIYAQLDRQDSLRPVQYIICLGGDPGRVIEAARLMNEGYGEKLIVTNHDVASWMMRDLAVDWGVPADRILMDESSWQTKDHPGGVAKNCGVDPRNDTCIIVTSYTHLARSKACFQKYGYQNILMREPRWDRQFRSRPSFRFIFRMLPEMIYEGGACLEYWICGWI